VVYKKSSLSLTESMEGLCETTDGLRLFKNTSEYKRFNSLIDFRLMARSANALLQERRNRPSSAQVGREVADKLVARRQQS